MTDQTRQILTQVYRRLTSMWRTVDRRVIGYHLGFAGLIVLIAALDVALRLALQIETANPLHLGLYPGFLGGALGLTVSYLFLLAGVISPDGPSDGPGDAATNLKRGLLGAMVVVPATLSGLCCCVFPGLLVACLLAPVPVLIMLRQYNLQDAVSRAVELARAQPVALLPIWLIVTIFVVVPLLFDSLSVLAVATAHDPHAWLHAVGPATRWLAAGLLGTAAIWALCAVIPVLDDSTPLHTPGLLHGSS